MTTIRKWTGRESRALREAMRLSTREFAGQLGMSDRQVSKWEARDSGISPRPDSQAILDTKLRQASDEVRARFELILDGEQAEIAEAAGDGNGKAEARVPYARTSLRREKREFRESMRATGLDYRRVATEFARVYKLRPRAAWREAYGWSLQDAAEEINAYRGNVGLNPGGLSGMTSAHLCEYENWPGYGETPSGRKPNPYLLAVLAAIYDCQVADLIDLADRKHFPKADLLVLDTYSRPPVSAPQADEDEDELSAPVTPLQAARRAKGWSQGRTVWEITNLAAKKKMTVASARSLKTQLSRWENGHITPEYYRPLLRELFGLTRNDLIPVATTREIAPHAQSDVLQSLGTGQTRAPEKFGVVLAHTSPSGSMAIDSPEPGPDTIVLNLRLGGEEVIVPISRRFLLRAGVSSFVEAFALDQQFDMVNDIMQRSRRAERLTIASPAHLQEILIHLREQWHALVKTDNLLGPRFALAGVLNQISVVEALRSILRDEQRIEAARLGAKYAESAAWLYEDTDNMTQARSWTSQAMEWAYEGNDERMLAWTIFRRAQQAAAIPDAAQTIGLAQAARRNEEKLATPTRAAIRVQEAYGHALDGNDQAAQRLLDEAHTWAAGDTVGDARE